MIDIEEERDRQKREAAKAKLHEDGWHNGRLDGLREAAKIVRKYKPLDWLANEIMEGIEE